MLPPVQAHLPAVELAGALSLWGVRPKAGSPLGELVGAGPPPGDAWSQALRAKGISVESEPWRQALDSLAAPKAHVHLELGTLDQLDAMDYYAAAGAWTAFRRTDEGASVTSGISTQSIVQWLAGRFPDGAPECEPELIRFSPANLVVFALCSDAIREEEWRSALERRRAHAVQFTREGLRRLLSGACAQPDPRWLAGLLRMYLPGSGELMTESLLAQAGETVELPEEWVAWAAALKPLLPFAAIQFRSHAGWWALLVVQAAPAYAIFRFALDEQGSVQVSLQFAGSRMLYQVLEGYLDGMAG